MDAYALLRPRTVYASIGQDTVVVTPIALLRAIASIGVHGKMYVPHLMKEFKPIGAMGEEGTTNYFEPRTGFGFDRPEPKMVPMTDAQYELMVKGMWGVVQGGGTGAGSHNSEGIGIGIGGSQGIGVSANSGGIGANVGGLSTRR